MWSKALALLNHATRAVPAVRYAIGVAGIMAALALGITLLKSPQAAILGTVSMLILMVLLLVFAAATTLKGAPIRVPAMVMTWAIVVLFVVSATLTVSAVFFSKPKPFPELITALWGGGQRPDIERLKKTSERLLDSFYRRDTRALYDMFTPSLRTSIQYAQFAADEQKEASQFVGNPIYRRFENAVPAAGFISLRFTAEFDDTSRFQEIVTFATQDNDWLPWRFDIWPESWPLIPTTKILSEKQAADVVSAIRNTPEASRVSAIKEHYEQFYTPGTGWRVVIDNVLNHVAERTCDVAAHEQSGTPVLLNQLLGGCALKTGQVITALGRVASVVDDRVALEKIRFMTY